MPRRKSAKNIPIHPWCSAKVDCREDFFAQIGLSLFASKREKMENGKKGPEQNPFLLLTNGARILYIAMVLEAKGKRCFDFPRKAAENYGLTISSFRAQVDELEKAGFIDVDRAGATREKNHYTFSTKWKYNNNSS